MNKWLWIALSALMVLPLAANAEVYKWKDKDGTVRYSDTPPPSNVQQLPITGKKPVATRSASPEAAPADATPSASAPSNAASSDMKKKPASSEGDAIKRQKTAEDDKKKTEQAEAELKVKQQNCTTAKGNVQNYQQGGRIYKMNEKGEREYESDASIAQNLEQAKKDVEQYCE
jgi:uncharacterized protein DUF4124